MLTCRTPGGPSGFWQSQAAARASSQGGLVGSQGLVQGARQVGVVGGPQDTERVHQVVQDVQGK